MSDATQIRAVAVRVAAVATALRTAATSAERGAGVQWRSVGAEAYRQRLRERAARLRSLAGKVDTVETDLRRYARSVEERQHSLSLGAHDVVAGFVESVW